MTSVGCEPLGESPTDPDSLVFGEYPVAAMIPVDELGVSPDDVDPEGELGPERVSPVVEPESELGSDAAVGPPEQQMLKDSGGGSELPVAQLIVLHSSSDPSSRSTRASSVETGLARTCVKLPKAMAKKIK